MESGWITMCKVPKCELPQCAHRHVWMKVIQRHTDSHIQNINIAGVIESLIAGKSRKIIQNIEPKSPSTTLGHPQTIKSRKKCHKNEYTHFRLSPQYVISIGSLLSAT